MTNTVIVVLVEKNNYESCYRHKKYIYSSAVDRIDENFLNFVSLHLKPNGTYRGFYRKIISLRFWLIVNTTLRAWLVTEYP